MRKIISGAPHQRRHAVPALQPAEAGPARGACRAAAPGLGARPGGGDGPAFPAPCCRAAPCSRCLWRPRGQVCRQQYVGKLKFASSELSLGPRSWFWPHESCRNSQAGGSVLPRAQGQSRRCCGRHHRM